MSRLPPRKKTIQLQRGAQDRLVPKDFGEIMMHRFLPVLSLTYISAVVGIAAERGSIRHYLFEDDLAYSMGLVVAAWVSIPAAIWIMLHGSVLYADMADIWYKIIAALMVLVLMASFILFPEAGDYGLRTYFAATMPVFLVMYLFFVKGGLPPLAAHPLTALGLTALVHGAFVSFS